MEKHKIIVPLIQRLALTKRWLLSAPFAIPYRWIFSPEHPETSLFDLKLQLLCLFPPSSTLIYLREIPHGRRCISFLTVQITARPRRQVQRSRCHFFLSTRTNEERTFQHSQENIEHSMDKKLTFLLCRLGPSICPWRSYLPLRRRASCLDYPSSPKAMPWERWR